MQAGATIYDKSSLWQNILIHLMKHVPELWHIHTVKVEHQSIQIPSIFRISLFSVIRNWRHNSKFRLIKLIQFFKIISNCISLTLTIPFKLNCNTIFFIPFFNSHSNSIRFIIFIVSFTLKSSFRKYVSIKIIRFNLLIKLIKQRIFICI